MKIIIDDKEYEAVVSFRAKGRVLYDVKSAQYFLNKCLDEVRKQEGDIPECLMPLVTVQAFLGDARATLGDKEDK